jgi:hypothetical protein
MTNFNSLRASGSVLALTAVVAATGCSSSGTPEGHQGVAKQEQASTDQRHNARRLQNSGMAGKIIFYANGSQAKIEFSGPNTEDLNGNPIGPSNVLLTCFGDVLTTSSLLPEVNGISDGSTVGATIEPSPLCHDGRLVRQEFQAQTPVVSPIPTHS